MLSGLLLWHLLGRSLLQAMAHEHSSCTLGCGAIFVISAALQASWETLVCVAEFLKRKNLTHQLKTEELWKFAECLVRMAWKCQAQPGAAP